VGQGSGASSDPAAAAAAAAAAAGAGVTSHGLSVAVAKCCPYGGDQPELSLWVAVA
jgi:hypothetical protein